MKPVLLFVIAFAAFKIAVCQTTIGKPDILNFSHEVSKSGSQTWKILQDRFGVMYFANNSGLLSYNGREWKLFPLPNKTIVRSIYMADDDKIFAGGQDAIGYYFPDGQGTMIYHSLIESIPTAHRSFGDVWNIVEYENAIFFRTTSKIFRLDRRNNRFTIFICPPQSRWLFMGVSQKTLYAQNETLGLMHFTGNQWKALPTPALTNTFITSVQDFGRDTTLIATMRNGLFLMHKKDVQPFAIPVEIIKSRVFLSLRVGNAQFAIGTVSNGIYIIDKSGKILMHFSTNNGLQNNNVLSLYIDAHSNLWAGLDEGIDLINYKSPINKIPVADKPSPVYTANIFGNKLYLGTSDGLYATDLTVDAVNDINFSQNPFYRIQNSERQVWNLFNSGEQLLMAHHAGSFDIKGHNARFLDDFYGGAWLYRHVPASKNIVAGTYNGLQLFQYQNNELIPTQKLSSAINETLRFIEVDSAHNIIWASHPYRGIYKIKMSANYDRIDHVKLYNKEHGLPDNTNNFVFKIRNEIVFPTENGIYAFDYSKEQFTPSVKYAPVFGKTSVKFMAEDKQNRIWFATETGMGVVEGNKLKPIPELDGKLIAGFENIHPYNDQNILIGSNKGLIHLNYSLYEKRYSGIDVLLNKVIATAENDSLLYNGYYVNNSKLLTTQAAAGVYKLPPAFNSFRFEFSSTQYGRTDKTEYSYQLQGFDQEWSQWSNRNEKDYTNLQYGKYTFMVKARDNLGNISTPVSYSFEIRPRWYQTNFAYAAYFVLLISLFVLANTIHRKRLKKQKEKFLAEQMHLKYVHELELEHNEKQIVQLKNDRLETEVIYKNKELATTTMHLYKRGRLLGKIKEDLTEGIEKLKDREDKAGFKKLIKLLAEEEKKDLDWEQFSIHFDQVHNNFLHNIKQAYPHLTPGDLKICAYLKMNLSSKEIAQLLNISLKGVEIARYRLRKKLAIAQDVNLIHFITEFG